MPQVSSGIYPDSTGKSMLIRQVGLRIHALQALLNSRLQAMDINSGCKSCLAVGSHCMKSRVNGMQAQAGKVQRPGLLQW